MKIINRFAFMFLLVPNICLANLISVEIDFWDYTLDQNWADIDPTVYDGQMVLKGAANSDFTEFVFSEGFIAFGGNVFSLFSGTFTYTDYSEYDWDYIITRTHGSYVDALGIERTAWAHIEGVGSASFYSGETIGSEGFVMTDIENPLSQPGNRPVLQPGRLTVVSEPSIFAIMSISLTLLLTSRKVKRSRYNMKGAL